MSLSNYSCRYFVGLCRVKVLPKSSVSFAVCPAGQRTSTPVSSVLQPLTGFPQGLSLQSMGLFCIYLHPGFYQLRSASLANCKCTFLIAFFLLPSFKRSSKGYNVSLCETFFLNWFLGQIKFKFLPIKWHHFCALFCKNKSFQKCIKGERSCSLWFCYLND